MRIFVLGLNDCIRRNFVVDRYKSFLEINGHEIIDNPNDADLILIWSCYYADRREGSFQGTSLEVIAKYQKYFKDKIVVCGCLPSIDENSLKQVYKGYYFSWKDGIEKLQKIVGEFKIDYHSVPGDMGEDILIKNGKWVGKKPKRTRAYYYDQFKKLMLSEGCLGKCTYCIEKLAFPPYRSYPAEMLVSECKHLLKTPGNKIMLFADDIGDYGMDVDSTLPEFLDQLIKVNDNLLLGFEAISPKWFIKYQKELIDLIENKRVFFVSLPIQSANNRILKLMKREYTKEELEDTFSKLDKTDVDLETHLIVGFPSETMEELTESIDFIIRHRFKWVIVFSYIEVPLTASFSLPDKIPREEIEKRLRFAQRKLRNAGIMCNAVRDEKLEQIDPNLEI